MTDSELVGTLLRMVVLPDLQTEDHQDMAVWRDSRRRRLRPWYVAPDARSWYR
ncbi:MAG: hypothetical protein H0X59_02715 [Chloroflexi bacterium]|nr:hypothetical protein [Chloroflexota bacterium]